jgi:hypothetical protein
VKDIDAKKHETLRFSGRYTIEDTDTHRLVSWTDSIVTLWHYIPFDSKGIPYTRPDKVELDFLPPHPKQCKHWVNVRRTPHSPSTEDSYMNPRYTFESRDDRDRFQQAIRSCYKLTAFRALNIRSLDGSKSLSRSAELKIWAPDAGGPRFSFAKNLLQDDKKKHDEYQLRWFHQLRPPTQSHIGVVFRLAAYRDVGGSAVPETKRKSSRSGSIRGFSTSPQKSISPQSRRASAESTALSIDTQATGDVPAALQRLGGLQVEFTREGKSASTALAWGFC